jgi:hypothetical protein
MANDPYRGPSLRRRASLRSSEVGLYFIEFGSIYNSGECGGVAVGVLLEGSGRGRAAGGERPLEGAAIGG